MPNRLSAAYNVHADRVNDQEIVDGIHAVVFQWNLEWDKKPYAGVSDKVFQRLLSQKEGEALTVDEILVEVLREEYEASEEKMSDEDKAAARLLRKIRRDLHI